MEIAFRSVSAARARGVSSRGALNVANFSMSTHRSGSKAVESSRQNRYGLFDMAGNVEEWYRDRYAADGYQTASNKDPKDADTGSDSGNRGGEFVRQWREVQVGMAGFFPSQHRSRQPRFPRGPPLEIGIGRMLGVTNGRCSERVSHP